jgi:hypothetical protein
MWRRIGQGPLAKTLLDEPNRLVAKDRLEAKWKDTLDDDQYLIIPGNSGPRWIIPRNSDFGWPAMQQWQPYHFSSKIKWWFVGASYRSGLLGCVPGIKRTALSQWLTLGDLLPGQFAGTMPVIYVGTPGLDRKLVIALVASDTFEIVGIAKIPLQPRAKSRIINEAKILRRLAKEKAGLAPLRIGLDRNKGVSIQQAVVGRQLGRRFSTEHMSFLHQLAYPSKDLSLQKYVGTLIDSVRSNPSLAQVDREFLARLLGRITSETLLPSVWIHGDFAPWNLMRSRDGGIIAIDWEAAKPRGLPAFDLLYYFTIQSFVFKHRRIFPRNAERLLSEYLKGIGIPTNMAHCLTIACLVEDCLRSCDFSEPERVAFLLHHLREISWKLR